ncbi:MAG TPA: KpsF/GutQ family sugar-phosphate isomerase [Steroidobacteraceae bacterium]|jgi:arabinose-5-phosphate isomerase|nr:KpsF/GutQ family sugar-phosphate isomerase [Steroidobacteraceae bacterium]
MAVPHEPQHSQTSESALLASAQRTLGVEIAGLTAIRERLDGAFAAACHVCLGCVGRVVVTGMGKSGHVARKIAATLSSTGTPAFFLHPGEAGHGDIGMLTRGDVLLALSNSGETLEVLGLLPYVKRLALPLIGMTGHAESTLARAADVHLNVGVAVEACPHNLAPTASTTATLVMGDALAVALLEARGFSADDFARSHPGGSLGRRLLTRVEDIMRRGDALPRVRPSAPLAEGLLEMTRKGLGLTAVLDEQDRVIGVFTDGDLRRVVDRRIDVHSASMSQVMTRGGRAIEPLELATAAAQLMERHRVTTLLVVDPERRLVGALNVHDLMRAGVV